MSVLCCMDILPLDRVIPVLVFGLTVAIAAGGGFVALIASFFRD